MIPLKALLISVTFFWLCFIFNISITLICFTVSISLMKLSTLLSTFHIRALNLLFIVMLNSLTYISNGCIISKSDFDQCFDFGEFCFLSYYMPYNFLLKVGHLVKDIEELDG